MLIYKYDLIHYLHELTMCAKQRSFNSLFDDRHLKKKERYGQLASCDMDARTIAI